MKRKTVTMVVTVTIPAEHNPAWARKEVRTLINEQCGFHSDPGDLKVRRIRLARKAGPETRLKRAATTRAPMEGEEGRDRMME